MVELVDTPVLEAGALCMGVRVPLPAPYEGTATTVVLRQTVNLLRKVNIVGSTPTPFTKFIGDSEHVQEKMLRPL